MRVLNPGVDVPQDVDAYLPVEPDGVSWGWIPSSADGAAVVVPDGGRVAIDTLSHEGLLGDQGRDPIAFLGTLGVSPDEVLEDAVALAASATPHDQATDGPHVLTGPVAVSGARPGDLVGVRSEALVPRVDYGIVSHRRGRGLLPNRFPSADTGQPAPERVSHLGRIVDGRGRLTGPGAGTLAYRLRPFLGIVAVGDEVRVHTTRPGRFGGNLDARRMGVGTTWWLPVRQDGAFVSVGDPHHAQGDGEVAGTAVEGSLRATLRFEVGRDPLARWWAEEVDRPLGETPTHWLVPGFGDTVDDAARDAAGAAVDLVARCTGAAPALAWSALSAAADLQVTQAVNLTCGAHLLVPRELLR